jgi:hypothetical protein
MLNILLVGFLYLDELIASSISLLDCFYFSTGA